MVDVGLSWVGAKVLVQTMFASRSSLGAHPAKERCEGWIQGLMVSWFGGIGFCGFGV